MSKIIFHIDVNSAFLSWSALEKLKNSDEIDLRNIPAIIGGDQSKRHGVVLAKSVPAKQYGIVTGEPVIHAIRKCPNLVMTAPDHQLYSRYSKAMMTLLLSYTPDIEQVSVDECFLDFTPIAHHYPSAKAAAQLIQNQIKEQLGFTVNIGIAPNKLLAKMASDFQKPDQIHTLFTDEIATKMWPLSVGELYGVGRASSTRLMELGINTIGNLAKANPDFLFSHFKSHGKYMSEAANGIDYSRVDSSQRELKGIGNSTTLSTDVTTLEGAMKVLLTLSESVAKRLRQKVQLASSVTVEIKYSTFTTTSHQTTLMTSTNTTDVIYKCACTLFEESWNQQPIRLLGIRTAKLEAADTPVQLSIFDFEVDTDKKLNTTLAITGDKQHKLDVALDNIRQKHGSNSIVRGSLFKNSNSK
jgi:Nucleotidyltransferase/DNA polymerase involved in DNA repair